MHRGECDRKRNECIGPRPWQGSVWSVQGQPGCQRGCGVRERRVSGEEAREATRRTDHERPTRHSTDCSFHSDGDGNHAEVCSRKMTCSV